MRTNIPAVTKNLLIINTLAFLATWVLEAKGVYLSQLGGLHFFLMPDFHLYQLITYQFLHGNLSHVFWNMFALYMFGVVMEQVWGGRKFLFYYLSCGVGAGLMQELVQFLGFSYVGSVTIGASGAVYAILLAFGMTFPNERIMLLIPPIPIKAKWFVIGYAAIELMLAITSSGDGVAHMSHLGGMLFGFFMIRYWNRHPNSNFEQNGSSAGSFFSSMKRKFGQWQDETHQNRTGMHAERGGEWQNRHRENERSAANQEEIDRILDKIRKSGYDSLTKEEKQKLFDASRK